MYASLSGVIQLNYDNLSVYNKARGFGFVSFLDPMDCAKVGLMLHSTAPISSSSSCITSIIHVIVDDDDDDIGY